MARLQAPNDGSKVISMRPKLGQGGKATGTWLHPKVHPSPLASITKEKNGHLFATLALCVRPPPALRLSTSVFLATFCKKRTKFDRRQLNHMSLLGIDMAKRAHWLLRRDSNSMTAPNSGTWVGSRTQSHKTDTRIWGGIWCATCQNMEMPGKWWAPGHTDKQSILRHTPLEQHLSPLGLLLTAERSICEWGVAGIIPCSACRKSKVKPLTTPCRAGKDPWRASDS